MKLTVNKSKKLFAEYLKESGYKENTITTKLVNISVFLEFVFNTLSLDDIRDVTAEDIKEFLKELECMVTKSTNQLFTRNFKTGIFLTMKLYFKALYIKELILFDPSLNIKYKPSGEIKEKVILSAQEMERLLDSIEGKTYIFKRDRALFELMYSSGLRAGEAVNLKKSDINLNESLAFIRLGKFGKDRIVPISEAALYFLKRIINRVNHDSYIFVGSQGSGKLSICAVNTRLKKYLKLAEIENEGVSSHSIRHSTATHLLDRGADLRYVQTLLGHESIETTVVYTHMVTEGLKRIYRSHHPRENQYYLEVDSDYLNNLESLKTSLLKQKAIRERKRGKQ